jgi:sugar phosphate isomerase/epimerase
VSQTEHVQTSPHGGRRDAHDLRSDDLVLSYFSLARYSDFDERLQAAAAAGFAGIGMFVLDYQRLRDDVGLRSSDIRAKLDGAGLCIAEIEVMRGWAPSGEPAAQSRAMEALAFEMADEFGGRYLQAIGPYEGTVADAARGFGGLCDRAAEHDLLVGIEWVPFTNIRTAADALAIVAAADRPNGGLCVDIWHHIRGAADESMIRALPPERIFAVQLSDGPLTPQQDDYYTDCLDNRVPPGQGEFDVAGFVAVLDAMGVEAPISLEVCSARLRDGSADEAARQAAEAMHRVLATARPG